MIEIEAEISHALGQQAALERMHHLVASLNQRFRQQVHRVQMNIKDQRLDVSFAAYGYVVHWEAEVYDDHISLLGRIPESASKFRRKIEEAVVDRVETALLPLDYGRAA